MSASRKALSPLAPVALVALVTAGGSLALTLGPLAQLTSLRSLEWINVWTIAAAFGLTEALPIHLEHRREAISITLTTIPLVIGLVGLTPVALIVARLGGSALALVLHRRQGAAKLSVNLASFWAQTAVSIMVFRHLDGHTWGPGSWVWLYVAVIAGDIVQSVALTAAISLYQRRWELSLVSSAGISCVAAAVETSVGVVALSLLVTQPAAMLPLATIMVLVLLSYRTHHSLRERHQELGRLYDFAGVIGDALIDGEVVGSLLSQVRTLMHADQAWLFLMDKEESRMRVSGSSTGTTTEADDGLGAALERIITPGSGAVLVDSTDRRLSGYTAGAGARQLLAAPLTGRDGRIGTLVAVNRSGHVRGFGQKDLRLFTTIANHARVSLENDSLVDRLRERVAESEYLSLHDALTGLPNRVLFSRLVGERLEGVGSAAVLLLDLDRFKEVNDTLGHHNGDLLLQQVGGRLRTALRRGDVIARLGGDEFAVLLAELDGEEEALHAGRGIVALLEQPFQINDMSVHVGASIGIAFAPRDGADPGTLVQRADVAMYTAKSDQTGVEMYRADRDGYSPERLTLVSELKRAVDEEELDIYFQPQVDLATGDVIGVEALLRWTHPTRGTVPAEHFIAIAEHTGLIQPLTQFVLDHSLAAARRWRDAGYRLRVSVNLSAKSLLEPTLAGDVAVMLARHGMPASALCLEVTESSIMGDPRRSAATLTALRDLGITISVDDFGTGQSSLAYIKRLPVGEIKIDKSFVLSMMSDHSDHAIVETVLNLGRNLGVPVTAEGVEDDATRRQLQAMGCPVGQGYHFARPMDEAAFVDWLEREQVDRSAAVVSLADKRTQSMARTG